MNELIHVKCLKHIYPDQTEVSLCGFEFSVKKGERVVILGKNGSGKTTLISHILGLLSPVEGTVTVMGKKPYENFDEIRKHIGVIFQNVDEQIIGPTVYDDIGFTLRSDGYSEEEVKDKVVSAAQTLGIDHLLQKVPHYLSGGQKKKVALAGALASLPEIIILDEPFNALDPKSKKEMIALVNHLNKEHHVTVIITTHDIDIVSEVADTVYVLNEGQIVAKGNPLDVFTQIDLLKEAHLDLPILYDLFFRLRNQGFDIPFPQNIDHAESLLKSFLKV